jgi:hypothetical protein
MRDFKSDLALSRDMMLGSDNKALLYKSFRAYYNISINKSQEKYSKNYS